MKIILCFILSFIPLALQAGEPIHHELSVSLKPDEHRLFATDTITLSGDQEQIKFALHAGFEPSSPDPKVAVDKEADYSGPVPLESFIVTLPKGVRTFTLRYTGVIHPATSPGREMARGSDQTAGDISDEGVYLAGSAFWYPQFGPEPVSFSLSVELASPWIAVSQGSRTVREISKTVMASRWDSPEPQNEIYLIAARFSEYEKISGKLTAMVFLRTPDAGLAAKYLDATLRYIALYDNLIGPYPYAKFALVENFRETGFGMPSFTLLGPKVVRLPFIINTSYPHEILHNWWGNGVFPDYEKGNWSEGLTAYLADHLMKEQQSGASEYRLTTLQKYADYVRGGEDFPLTRFTSRHSSLSEAIGYGKALMFFHMLRNELGDDMFTLGLRDFYEKCKFRVASYEDIRKSFESVSGKDLKREFDQWVARAGAPALRLSDAGAEKSGENYEITAMLKQVQPGEPYRLRIPVAVTMEGRAQAFQTTVEMNAKSLELKLHLPARPLRIDVDPEYDIFRRLDREELPPAITQALGAKQMLILLPSSSGKALLQAYRALAEDLRRSGPEEVEVKLDSELKRFPEDRAVTLLGWENKFLPKILSALSVYQVAVNRNSVRIGREEIVRRDHSFVFAARRPGNRDMAVTLIASDSDKALPGLGQKLPHYHKYSYLAFEGSEPANVAKGRWPVVDSPMTAFLGTEEHPVGKVNAGALAPRRPLAALPPDFSKDRMMETVRRLSSDELGGRGLGTPELDRAADYIAEQFHDAGLLPGADDGKWFQVWKETRAGSGVKPTLKKKNRKGVVLKNVIGVIPGRDPLRKQQSVVIAAHYDHLGRKPGKMGKADIYPGADDNASGVAILLELARALKGLDPGRNIVFVAFTGEEEGRLGSIHYLAEEKRFPPSQCIGMVDLDTVGRLGKRKLVALGADSAKEWAHIFRGAAFVAGVDIETVSREMDVSDQKSFEEAGVPAVQLFSGPHSDYHRPTDTADKIDADGMISIAAVAKETVEYLAGSEKFLTTSR